MAGESYLPGRLPRPTSFQISDPLRPVEPDPYELPDLYPPPPEMSTGPLPIAPPERPGPIEGVRPPDPLVTGVTAGRPMPPPVPVGGGRGTMGGITGGGPVGPPMGGGVFGAFGRPQMPPPPSARPVPAMPPGISRAPGLGNAPGLSARGGKPPGMGKYRG